MKNTLNQYLERFQKKRRNYRRYQVLFLVLAIITVAGVNWKLHRKGISMTLEVSGYEQDAGTDQLEAEDSVSGGEDPDDNDTGSGAGSDTEDPGNTDDKNDSSEDGNTDDKDDSSEDGNTGDKDDSSEDGNTDDKDDSSEDGNTSDKDDSSENGTSDEKGEETGDDENQDDQPEETEDGLEKSETDETANAVEDPNAEKTTGVNAGAAAAKNPELILEEIKEESGPEAIVDWTDSIRISGSGTKYDADNNLYSSDLQIDFTFAEDAVSEDKLEFYYDYPEGIIVPANLLGNNYSLLDDAGKTAGTYWFEENEDGIYRVRVRFNENYAADKKGATISGYIKFAGQIDANKVTEDDNNITIGSDKVELVIPKDEITYPEDSNGQYDLKTSKEGKYVAKDNQLVYTVYVYSLKGTPGEISLEDVIDDVAGLELAYSGVMVTEEKITRTFWKDGTWTDYTDHTDDRVLGKDEYECYPNGTKLNMTLPQIKAAEEGTNDYDYKTYTRYKVQYIYDIKGTVADNTNISNTVTGSSGEGNTKVVSSDNAKVSVSNNYTISKGGLFGEDRDLIRWEIKLNANGQDIAGYQLTDDMLAKAVNGVTISPSTGYTINKDENGKIKDITFDAVDGGKNNNTYTITYWTPSGAGWDNTTVTNTANLKPGNGGEGVSATETITNVSGGTVAKNVGDVVTSEDGNTAKITWNVTVTMPEAAKTIPTGMVIKDDPTKDKWGVTGGNQYLTKDQVIAWADNIYWADEKGNQIGNGHLDLTTDESLAEILFEASDGKEYTWQQIYGGSGGTSDDLTYTVCTITLKKDVTIPEEAKKLLFQYTTTADLGDESMGKIDYKNTFSIGKKTGDANYEYNKGGVVKTDENDEEGTTVKKNSDGKLIWKIKVNTSADTGTLTFKDTLPPGVTLEKLYGQDQLSQLSDISIDESGNISGNGGSYTASGTYEGNIVTVKIEPSATGNKMQSGLYTLVVVCKVDQDTIGGYESGKTYTFTNSASVRDDNGTIGDAEQTQDWTEDTTKEDSKVISKTGEWKNSERRLYYSIELNPDEKDIVEGSDVLTLTDVFTYYDITYALEDGVWQGTGTKYPMNAWLLQDSVKLYKAEKQSDGTLKKGEEITDWKWTVTTAVSSDTGQDGGHNRTSTLTGTVPDSTAMILEYQYQLQADIPANWHADRVPVSNSAALKGTGHSDSSSSDSVNWAKATTEGQVTADIRGVLYKVSKGNYGKTLPGAVFRLQKWAENDSGSGSYVDTDITYTTDESGKIVIHWQKTDTDVQYEHNVLYRAVETDAPEGYVLPADPEENAFYFYFSSSADTTHTLPSEISDNAADLSKASKVVYVENESNSTSITIHKKWLKPDGEEDTAYTGSITVDLYRKESTTPPSGGGEAILKGAIHVYDINNTGSTWMTIEKTFPAGSNIKLIITSDDEWVANPAKDYSYAPVIQINGTEIQPETEPWNGTKTVHTYTFQLNEGENEILGGTKCWQDACKHLTAEFQVQESDNTEDNTTATFVRSCTISSTDNWIKTIEGLPTSGLNDKGEKVYYTYYIKEESSVNYTPSYSNNDGILSGTIEVTNQLSNNPSYVLPETGGCGTKRYMTAGMLLMSAALLCGYVGRTKKQHIFYKSHKRK